ncbi:hypothetical protein M758_9G129700 [Ceratodon purpureus]|nr:hypothetical protein M758_9G129700 [Ceratodon purpureus]
MKPETHFTGPDWRGLKATLDRFKSGWGQWRAEKMTERSTAIAKGVRERSERKKAISRAQGAVALSATRKNGSCVGGDRRSSLLPQRSVTFPESHSPMRWVNWINFPVG